MSKYILPIGSYMLDEKEHGILYSFDDLKQYCCLTENGEKLFKRHTVYTFNNGLFDPFYIPASILKAEDVLDLENWDWCKDEQNPSTKEKDIYHKIGKNIKSFYLGLPDDFTKDMSLDLIKDMIKAGEGFGAPGIEKKRNFSFF